MSDTNDTNNQDVKQEEINDQRTPEEKAREEELKRKLEELRKRDPFVYR